MIQVTIRFVDGGIHEYTEGRDFLTKLKKLQDQGYTGRDLIHELFTDDWAAPPLSFHIKSNGSGETDIDLQIPYA